MSDQGLYNALDPASPSQSHRPQTTSLSVGKALARGGTGPSDGWAVDATSVTYFTLPTSPNLAGMPPVVNHLGETECADGVHRRLPGPGTFRAFSLLLCTGECGEVRLFLR